MDGPGQASMRLLARSEHGPRPAERWRIVRHEDHHFSTQSGSRMAPIRTLRFADDAILENQQVVGLVGKQPSTHRTKRQRKNKWPESMRYSFVTPNVRVLPRRDERCSCAPPSARSFSCRRDEARDLRALLPRWRPSPLHAVESPAWCCCPTPSDGYSSLSGSGSLCPLLARFFRLSDAHEPSARDGWLASHGVRGVSRCSA